MTPSALPLLGDLHAGPWRIERFAEIGSTSDDCAARARVGEADGLVLLAATQNAGRGRSGRAWVSPVGNLYMSVLLRPACPAVQGGQFALLAGLSLAEALAACWSEHREIGLKWPNDVMIGPAKLAGVLLDASVDAAGMIEWMVIGFGANLVAAPALPDRRTVALAEFAPPPSPEDLAVALLARLAFWRADVARDGGAALRSCWLARAHPLGTALTVDGGRLAGWFEGIDVEGSLLLRMQDGAVQRVRSGDVGLP